MNPQTGEILAMVSLPTYDNNAFARGHQQQRTTRSCSRIPTSRSSITPSRRTTRPARRTSSSPGPARWPTGRSRRRRGSRRSRLPDARRRRSSTTGTTAASGPCNIYCGFGHSSDTFFFQLAGMLGIDRLGVLGQAVRLRRADRDRSARRGVRDRPDQRSGSRTPSARRSSRARPTRPASARATTS